MLCTSHTLENYPEVYLKSDEVFAQHLALHHHLCSVLSPTQCPMPYPFEHDQRANLPNSTIPSSLPGSAYTAIDELTVMTAGSFIKVR